jgi:hypothetical protein
LVSIFSVTCCSTSRAVAPGQAADTTICLMVKGGSSARPRLKKA